MTDPKQPKTVWEQRNRYRLVATHSRALPEVWHKFKQLAKENKRTANAALGLLIEDAIKRWKLPTPKTPKKPH